MFTPKPFIWGILGVCSAVVRVGHGRVITKGGFIGELKNGRRRSGMAVEWAYHNPAAARTHYPSRECVAGCEWSDVGVE